MMDDINHTEYFITCANPFYDSVLFRFIIHVSRQSKSWTPRFALAQEPLEIEVILVGMESLE